MRNEINGLNRIKEKQIRQVAIRYYHQVRLKQRERLFK